MAETEKKSFVLYFDTYFSISALPAEQRGELFSALFEYAMAEAEAPAEEDVVLNQHPEMGVAARMAFSFMAKSIRRDTEKWREKHVRYQQAAQQRWQDTARSRQESGAVPRKAREQADSKGGGDIWKYVRGFSTASRLPKSEDSDTLDAR